MISLNGKKVLNRLIMLFIIINIILVILNIIADSTRYILTKDRMQNISLVLNNRGVTIESPLPINFEPRASINIVYEVSTTSIRDKITKKMFGDNLAGVLRSTKESDKYNGVKYYQFNKGQEMLSFERHEIGYINKAINTQTKGLSKSLAKKHGDGFISRIGMQEIYKLPYIEYEEIDNYIRIKYYPTIEGVPVDDINITMDIYEKGVNKAILTLARVEYIEDSYREIIPVDRVLFGIDRYIYDIIQDFKGDICITDIKLVYKKQNLEGYNLWGEKNIPMYKMSIRGLEKSIFVNAYTNDYIR